MKNFNKILVKVFASLIFVFSVSTCSQSIAEVYESSLQLPETVTQERQDTIPYASVRELESLTKSGADGIVDYRVARAIAIVDFETAYREELSLPKGIRLSTQPIVLYNAQGEPHLYEFIVLESGNPVATVTTYAHTKYPEVIRNVLPFVRNYEPFITKYSNYKQVS